METVAEIVKEEIPVEIIVMQEIDAMVETVEEKEDIIQIQETVL